MTPAWRLWPGPLAFDDFGTELQVAHVFKGWVSGLHCSCQFNRRFRSFGSGFKGSDIRFGEVNDACVFGTVTNEVARDNPALGSGRAADPMWARQLSHGLFLAFAVSAIQTCRFS